MTAVGQLHIAFRVDASIQIGTGHVVRCLTLADALCQRGVRCTFICRAHEGHLLDVIAQRGYNVVALPCFVAEVASLPDAPSHASWLGVDWQTDAQETCDAVRGKRIDWLVVDHYALDESWERVLRGYCQKLMVIDDLADRPHDCDALLDQNLGRSTQDYSDLLKSHTSTFIGPKYALLRPEFALLRNKSIARRVMPQLKRLLITLGGVDKDNATGQVLQALSESNLPCDLSVTVVMGEHAPYLSEVKEQAAKMKWPIQLLVGVREMAQLMTESDLCIGAAGGTSWERCCLGLPTLLLVLANNQIDAALALEERGAVIALQNPSGIPQIFEKLFSNIATSKLKRMSEAAANVSDGEGVKYIVASMIKGSLHV